LLVMMTLGTYSLFRAWREPSAALFRNAGAAGLFVLASLIHADFVGVGWFYRYEAYLIAVGMTTALPAFVNVLCAFMTPRDDRQTFHTFIFVAIVIILFWPFITRSVSSLVDTPLAYRNIGDQQMQLARFLAAKGTGKVVALNDIGAVGYYSDTPILDLFGLASPEVYRVRIRHEYSTETIDRLVRQAGAETAILTPDWYRMFGGIPASWTQVATWKIENNIICASDAVSFYAIEPDAREDLERRLKEFEPSLPFDVKATFTGSSGR
nr:hypothetical protein [Candidatus Ozemobacteraceae bacterium]